MKDESHIVGREYFVNELVSQLINGRDHCANLGVISVFSEEGIGKTALVRSICNRADIKNHFDSCAWVWAGPEPNLVRLMFDLLKQLRVPKLQDVDHMDKKKLSEMLLGVLMERHYLIVLDDLCDVHLMDKLIIKVLADSRNGSRVIVTTRNPDIPPSIDPWDSRHLKLSPLDPGQSKKLLEKCSLAFDVIDPSEGHRLKETILSKSGGSPPMILLLGGLLSATTSEGLLSATTSDRCTELANLLTNGLSDRPTLQDVVRRSVDDLPVELKQCAQYLTLFPKESEIPTRRLFRLWSAENLLSSASENRAEEYLQILVSRHMVHVTRQKWDGSARSCRLPGPLYNVFYQMAKNERFPKICDCNERFLKIYDCSIHDKKKFDAPRIAIHKDIYGGGEANAQVDVPEAGRGRSETNAREACKEIIPAEPHQRMSPSSNSKPCGIQQLSSIVSFNTMKLGTRALEIAVLLKPLVPKRDSSLLEVLDLEGVYKPLLPEELGNILPNLKYLGLRWTLLERLPESVALLSCLETLDLKYTNISSLPDSILEAKNLRHLYMTEVGFDCSTHHLSSLNCNIQTIWGLVMDKVSLMGLVLCQLTGLWKLALTLEDRNASEATKYISNLKMLKSLRLRLKHPQGNPHRKHEMSGMSGLNSLSNLYLLGLLGKQSLLESDIPPSLKVLTLSNSRLKDDPMGVLGKLKCLTTLRLFAGSYEGGILNVSGEGTFPSLRVLKLRRLRSAVKWTIQANAMPRLQDLEIKECHWLKIDGLEHIKTLEEITLVNMSHEFEQRVRDLYPKLPIIAKNIPQGRSNRMKKTANEKKMKMAIVNDFQSHQAEDDEDDNDYCEEDDYDRSSLIQRYGSTWSQRARQAQHDYRLYLEGK